MRRWTLIFGGLLLWVAGLGRVGAEPAAPAEVIDLAEANLPVVELTALRRAPVSESPNLTSVRGYTSPGRRVQVQRWATGWYYVVAPTAGGTVTGWVAADAVSAPPADWTAAVQRRLGLTRTNREVIVRHEVVLGMTRGEVRSSLGEPRQRTVLTGRPDADEQWLYVQERYLPRHSAAGGGDGGTKRTISYRKVPQSERRVRFRRGEVVAVEERAAVATVLPP